MVLCSLFAALISLCAWLSLPIPPAAVTMQTFGVFLTLGILGGKYGSAAVFLYLLLGCVGLPVFSGFRGGVSALLSPSGGFLWGFLVAALVFWLVERFGKTPAMIAGMAACYGCGCWWFTLYAGNIGWGAAVMTCVVPYLIPDAIKLGLACTMSNRIRRSIKR